MGNALLEAATSAVVQFANAGLRSMNPLVRVVAVVHAIKGKVFNQASPPRL
jgi:hypothetical protein